MISARVRKKDQENVIILWRKKKAPMGAKTKLLSPGYKNLSYTVKLLKVAQNYYSHTKFILSTVRKSCFEYCM